MNWIEEKLAERKYATKPIKPFGPEDQSIYVELVQWFNEGGVYTGITIEQMENECREIWLKLDGKHYE